jgi:hypothetical protein
MAASKNVDEDAQRQRLALWRAAQREAHERQLATRWDQFEAFRRQKYGPGIPPLKSTRQHIPDAVVSTAAAPRPRVPARPITPAPAPSRWADVREIGLLTLVYAWVIVIWLVWVIAVARSY